MKDHPIDPKPRHADSLEPPDEWADDIQTAMAQRRMLMMGGSRHRGSRHRKARASATRQAPATLEVRRVRRLALRLGAAALAMLAVSLGLALADWSAGLAERARSAAPRAAAMVGTWL